MDFENLLALQNRDGGWPYVHGGSWTEPAVFAVLALRAAGETDASGRGIAWLRAAQRPDGGWSPRAEVQESTWVTALAALIEPAVLGADAHRRAIEWLLRSTGKESTLIYRLRLWLAGREQPAEMDHSGWPWFPETAGWVGPTSFAMLALEKEHARQPAESIAQRIAAGRRFLASRSCAQGGWNHGSVKDLAYNAHPYPEMTGVALAALRGTRSAEVDRGLETAQRLLRETRSADGVNWLRLGLMAHGRLDPSYQPPALKCRTVPEIAMDLIMNRAPNGRGVFLA